MFKKMVGVSFKLVTIDVVSSFLLQIPLVMEEKLQTGDLKDTDTALWVLSQLK